MLRMAKRLKVRSGSGYSGLLVRNGSKIPLGPGWVFTVEMEGRKAEDTIKQVMVREAQADKVALNLPRGVRQVAGDRMPVPVLQQLEIS